jgi:hypothetical protein
MMTLGLPFTASKNILNTSAYASVSMPKVIAMPKGTS